ncbi:endonuclease domain-containing protein [Actinoplanes sp. NPDC051470]|uniref:endonuclease domain-containing protein n=1 Tax=Actinoplanes sp. NPDC051470 TaxID=3157224 RepID=UPI003418E6A9
MKLHCVVCETLLRGPQRKYCSDPECKARGSRAAWVFKTYGITLEQFDQILAYQGGVCGVCKRPFREGETPHIDHEHGAHVRGLVHAYCNTRLIGRLKSWEMAQNLADYLKEPPAVKALGSAVVAPGRTPRKRRRRYPVRKKT